MNKKERETIYAEWLAGAKIWQLSRKHHHWQKTIENVVRGCKINEDSVPLRQLGEMVSSLHRGLVLTYSDLKFNRSLVAALTDNNDDIPEDAMNYAIEKMTAWRRNYYDSLDALGNKAKAIGCPVKFQFDDYGLLLDVVPM